MTQVPSGDDDGRARIEVGGHLPNMARRSAAGKRRSGKNSTGPTKPASRIRRLTNAARRQHAVASDQEDAYNDRMRTRGDRLRVLARPFGELRGAVWIFGLLGLAVALWALFGLPDSGARSAGVAAFEGGREPLPSDAPRGAAQTDDSLARGVLARPLGSGARSAGGGPARADARPVSPRPVSLGSSAHAGSLQEDVRVRVEAAKQRAAQSSKGAFGAREVHVAVRVVELETGRVLVGLESTRGMRPASNMKLVTTAAALVIGGLQARFTTRCDASAPLSGGIVDGNLVLRAGGDPFLGPAGAIDGSGVERLDELAHQLAERGLRRVTGDLVLDEGSFEDPAPGPEWPDPDQHWKDYCALAGGFTVNGGCLVAEVESTLPGSAARVRVRPAAHGLRNDWRVETRADGSLVIGFEARLGRVLVRGSIPKNVRRWTESCSHPDPVALFGQAFCAALQRAGIELQGEVVRERGASGSHELLTYTSPVVDCLVPINTDSVNGVADQLFYAAGLWAAGDASRAGAARATAWALEELGISAEGLQQVDGSGLSFANRVTAEQLVGLLAAAHTASAGSQGDAAQRFRSSLAVAGRTGTLDKRMRGTCAEGRVLAKTGFIRGTSTLSGFIDSPTGPLAFAILVEYPPYSGLNTSVFKPLQDDICTLLCGAR